MNKSLMATTLFTILATVGCATNGNKPQQQRSDVKAEVFTKQVTASSVSQWDKADCRTTASKLEKKSWKELVAEANSCVRAEKWSNVEDIGGELARKDTNSLWGPYYLSLKAEHDGLFDRALWMAELASKRGPEVGLAHFQKGRILWKKEAYTESIEAFTKSLQLDSNMIDAHLFLGQIHFRDQDFSRAARHFQAVLKVRPRDPTALMGLAECGIQSSDARGALEYLEKGNRNYPGDPTFLLRQAYIYEVLTNDIAKAIEIYGSIQAGYQSGKYQRALDFSLTQKIRDLEMSIRGNRSVAGTASNEEKR